MLLKRFFKLVENDWTMNTFLKIFLFIIIFFVSNISLAQVTLTPQTPSNEKTIHEEIPKIPEDVKVRPETKDIEISNRIKNILMSTQWFINPSVKVKNGVVFLYGTTANEDYREWAERLASKTQDTVAVVNHIQVAEPSIFEFKPILSRFKNQWLKIMRMIPSFILAIIILIFTWFIAKFFTFIGKKVFFSRLDNLLLQKVLSWAMMIFIFLIGIYLLFYLMGLVGIAFTVIGGTGLLGIILGIAFKEITENLLASIVLSINNPFTKGDLVEIVGYIGYVQRMNLRSTILINLEGNYIQIPNSTVYKNTIRNFSSNPNRREDFIIGIGYNCNIAKAQEIALEVLKKHPAVLKDPEPWVLVDDLGKVTINLRIYFWLNGNKYSWLKIRSSIIRLIKKSFQENNIPMPDSERELIFPQGVPVRFIDQEDGSKLNQQLESEKDSAAISTQSEARLDSVSEEIEAQAKHSPAPEEGDNLLHTKNKKV